MQPALGCEPYVEEEIRYFKKLGRAENIFAVIVDGEPHAAVREGWDPDLECFPSALLYCIDDQGALTETAEPTEPIAADLRPGKDGFESGSLKLIAGLLRVGLDDLVQREAIAERGRRRRTQAIAGGFALLRVVAFFMWMSSENQREIAIGALEDIVIERAEQALSQGEYNTALRYALAAMHAAPKKKARIRVILAAAAYSAGGSGIVTAPDGKRPAALALSSDGVKFARITGGNAEIWNTASRTRLITLETFPGDYSNGSGGSGEASFSTDGNWLYWLDLESAQWTVWSLRDGKQLRRPEKPDDGQWPDERRQMFNAVSPDGSLAYWVDGEGRGRFWSLAQNREIASPFAKDAEPDWLKRRQHLLIGDGNRDAGNPKYRTEWTPELGWTDANLPFGREDYGDPIDRHGPHEYFLTGTSDGLTVWSLTEQRRVSEIKGAPSAKEQIQTPAIFWRWPQARPSNSSTRRPAKPRLKSETSDTPTPPGSARTTPSW